MAGSVYQPTTQGLVSPLDKGWSGGAFLGPSSRGRRWPRSLLMAVAAIFATTGIVMVIIGAKWNDALMQATRAHYEETHDLEGNPLPPPHFATHAEDTVSAAPYITLIVVGALFMTVALGAVLFYYRSGNVGLPCCPGKIARIRQRMHTHTQLPMTDGAVSAQYRPPCPAPPAPVPSEPPFTDVSEQQRLMQEDVDRSPEEDPRIVLSPLKSTEEV